MNNHLCENLLNIIVNSALRYHLKTNLAHFTSHLPKESKREKTFKQTNKQVNEKKSFLLHLSLSYEAEKTNTCSKKKEDRNKLKIKK